MRGLLTTLMAPALACLQLGCFVLDELDAGSAELKRRSGTPDPVKPVAEAQPDSKTVDLSKWWRSARSLTSEDSDASIVRCDLAGSVQFMRDADCQAQGGRPQG